MQTAIIIPVINEEDNLKKLIPTLHGLMPHTYILIVDDNSQDGTGAFLQTYKKKYGNRIHHILRKQNHGYGRSVSDGLQLCAQRGYDKVVTMDADFSHDPNTVPKLFEKLERYDIVIGSRYINGGAIQHWSMHRRMLSRFANWYVRTILNIPIYDYTSGFVAYNMRAIQMLSKHASVAEGYSFLVETKYNLAQLGLNIVEHPIRFTDRTQGSSKMSKRVIFEAVLMPWKIRFRKS
jgi:dolichol-phosphate mannosyltransferase